MKMKSRFLLGLALVGFFAGGQNVRAQTTPDSQQKSPPLIRSLEGPDLFLSYCASCHGLDAKGRGPAAPSLKTKVPDLTILARNSGGQFPSNRVRRTILGDDVRISHGSREMPIWGPIFHQVEADVDWGNVRVESLLKYLESIQTIGSSGAELYRQYCAACHGGDLKGTGPAPEPYRAAPDLTTLARRHGGQFPDAYVSNVLRNGVVMPAHGPAQMPAWGTDSRITDRSDGTPAAVQIANLRNYIKSFQVK
jgi:mono/diheme cytochrome c family protein